VAFKKAYADVYDALYQDKDYEKECDFLEEIFRKYDYQPGSILDMGCGTGNHALILAKRGYEVTGIDRSADMLAAARRKARNAGVRIEYVEGDITKINLDRKFDAVIALFAVMSYQVTNVAVAAACKGAKEALVPGGMFIFDCWHGLAVNADKPARRIKKADMLHGEKVTRFTEPEMDPINHIVKINFTVQKDIRDHRSETRETHTMRFFFPQEIKYYLETAGFEKIDLYPFLNVNGTLSDKDWNMAVVGR
jgi:SAM-dependent methyltransferase